MGASVIEPIQHIQADTFKFIFKHPNDLAH